jgi:broad specificity phosphatase PhoE
MGGSGSVPFDVFLAWWDRTTRERDWVPANGESSRQAGAWLREFLADRRGSPGPVAVVTHGGVTVDLLRDLLGDEAVPSRVLEAGISPCAVTSLDDLAVVTVASTTHLG